MTNVLQITYNAFGGGAGRAARRIHEAVGRSGIESTLHCARWMTAGRRRRIASKLYYGMRARAEAAINLLMKTPNPSPRWTASLPSNWAASINSSRFDLVHLHWICGGMMSIEDIGRINKPIVWTMHDMWAFCGSENLADDDRYAKGYRRNNRPRGETGLDLHGWTWRRKHRSWTGGFQVVAPSRWMKACINRSCLMHEWPVEVVPNPIDTDKWCPQPRAQARAALAIENDACVLCVAGIDGPVSRHKGYDLLNDALAAMPHGRQITLLVIGHPGGWQPVIPGVTIRFLGFVSEDEALRRAYCAADAMVVPSRIDNLPNTAVEAASCGLPVAAFDVGGLPDIVEHRVSGYLARPFDVDDLARGIGWVLDATKDGRAGRAARSCAVERFEMSRIGIRYSALYDAVLART